MALVTANAQSGKLDCNEDALAAALAALPVGAPVVVMIHGYRFMPGQPGHCPHEHILSLNPTPDVPRAISWPRHLGLEPREAGLALAFGWPSRGSLRGSYGRAALAARQLATLIARVRELDPDRPVDVIAHSLGARVALSALPQLGAGDVGRMILLAAAELQAEAAAALDTPAGRSAEVLNVTSRENALFDLLLETALCRGLSRSLGRGFPCPPPNWTDLRIDRPETVAALAARGFPLDPSGRRICHWSAYLRPGVFAIYRAILTRRIAPAALRTPHPAAPRPQGFRLRPPPVPGAPA